jgi:prefoldin subunit 4
MMGSGDDKVLVLTGEAFFETPEDVATTYCEEQVERLQAEVDVLTEEEGDILQQQDALKQILYGRFGKSINLEADD